MSRSAAILAALGLGEDASDAAVDAAILQFASLGRHVISVTGAPSPDAARGVLDAKLRDAATVPELREQLTKANAAAEEQARFALLEQGVREGKIEPALAFTWSVEQDPETGAERKVRKLSAWASPPHTDADGRHLGQTLDQLRAYLSSKATNTPPAAKVYTPDTSRAAEVVGDIEKRAQAAGVSADEYRAAAAAVAKATQIA